MIERRRDHLFRNIVRQLQSSLAPRAFILYDRGTSGEYRWVEFARTYRKRQSPAGGQQFLELYHLANHQRVGVRLQARGPSGGSCSRQVAAQLWEYQPGTMGTVDGQELPTAVRDWVDARVDTPGPC